MLLVQKIHKQSLGIYEKFQYIICCWFNPIIPAPVPFCWSFQYIICCWFNTCKFIPAPIIIVSIHYMLLVQLVLLNSKCSSWFEFQYIICCWFKLSKGQFSILNIMFQYIICCWFNYFLKLFFIIVFHVSIHYMLLVQIKKLLIKQKLQCFNTLYVVGSKTALLSLTWAWYVSIHYMLLVQLYSILLFFIF